jgi:hypothetical protein
MAMIKRADAAVKQAILGADRSNQEIPSLLYLTTNKIRSYMIQL